MPKRNIRKDTIRLTFLQFALDCGALALNLWLTTRAGSAAVGLLTLVGAFFSLAATATGGSGYLCASRFVAEALGEKNGNPLQVLRYALTCSGILGVSGCLLISCLAPFLAVSFFHDEDMTAPVRILAWILPLCGVTSCLKGWCNAVCRVMVAALCDCAEFLVRIGILVWYLSGKQPDATVDPVGLSVALTISMAAGTLFSCGVLLIDLWRHHPRMPSADKKPLPFSRYLRLAIPVMVGACLTAGLSAANDALIPITLRQSGHSAQAALSQFGIYEAIVIPVLFFPSTVLCVLSGLLIPETARATAAGNHDRLHALTRRTLYGTLWYGCCIGLLMLALGRQIAALLHADALAGTMIQMLAPVVPLIYLEIVLEAIIKGTGAQGFSSWNYLCEYTVRISVVLIAVPRMGFYGVLLSYYASNLFGNSMRIWKVHCLTGNSSVHKKFKAKSIDKSKVVWYNKSP